MKSKIVAAITILTVFSTMGFIGCRGAQIETCNKQTAEVTRGDLPFTENVTGKLKGPDITLSFDTSGSSGSSVVTWIRPGLKEGDFVWEGTVLARLDDFYQTENVKAAMYDVELAMNDLVQRIPSALAGYSKTYPDVDAALSLAQTREELQQTKEMLKLGRYQEAASKLLLAQLDIEASLKIFNSQEIKQLTQETDEFLGLPYQRYPEIPEAIKSLEQNIKRLTEIQKLIEQGSYSEAINSLDTSLPEFEETYSLVKSLSGRIVVSQRVGGECCQQLTRQEPGTSTGFMTLPYPDTSTSLDLIRQVQEDLQEIQTCKEKGCDELELSILISKAQHDVEMSQTIFEDNDLTFRSGLNLKLLRQYNLNVQTKRSALEKAKESLSKTDLLAPFDGFVQEIFIHQGEKFDKGAIKFIGIDNWTWTGVIDNRYKDQVMGWKAPLYMLTASKTKGAGKESGKVIVTGHGTVTYIQDKQDGCLVTISIDRDEVRKKLATIASFTGLNWDTDATFEFIDKNVLIVPVTAIRHEEGKGGKVGKDFIDVVINKKKFTTQARQVSVVHKNKDYAEISTGLSEGEEVMLHPPK